MFTRKKQIVYLWITNGKYYLIFSGGSQGSIASSVTEVQTQQPPTQGIKICKLIYIASRFEFVSKLK